MQTRLSHFIAGESGIWRIRDMKVVSGDGLPTAAYLDIRPTPADTEATWTLRGVKSNDRYTTRTEKSMLQATQEGLGRPEATLAALIPIKKNDAWWLLTQDERREIFEERSNHTTIGLRYLPAIARSLFHCRDLGLPEAFDFLTWFEFAPQHEADFNHLLSELRASPEWEFVEREVDIRLER